VEGITVEGRRLLSRQYSITPFCFKMNALANIKTITKRELGAYFSSPLAYIFIVIFLLLSGFFAFAVRPTLFDRGEASLAANFFFWHPWFYLFLVSVVGLRLWSE